MFKIGEINKLEVIRQSDFGYYLSSVDGKGDEDVLLPNGSTEGRDLKIGDEIDAFIYRDSKDRIIATLKQPLAKVGEISYLEVMDITSIGAFVSIGLERDVLVPFKEQDYALKLNHKYPFYIYLDKTERLAATTLIDKYLENTNDYLVGREVTGIVYGFQKNGSAMIIIDNKYRGVILKNEYYTNIEPGDVLTLRVKKHFEDGKMSLTPRAAAKNERLQLQDVILEYLKSHDGFMPYNDKTSPEVIRNTFHESKKYFKNALGGLMKEDLVTQDESGTYLKKI